MSPKENSQSLKEKNHLKVCVETLEINMKNKSCLTVWKFCLEILDFVMEKQLLHKHLKNMFITMSWKDTT